MDEALQSKFKEALALLGVADDWSEAVAALCAQELAFRKKLESLGGTWTAADFQENANQLEKRIKESGEDPPAVLMSIARSYPKLRAKIAHEGHKTPLNPAEINSVVTNTCDLITILFPNSPGEQRNYQEADALMAMTSEEGLVKRIAGMPSKIKLQTVPALVEKSIGFANQAASNSRLWESWRRSQSLASKIVKSMDTKDLVVCLSNCIKTFGASEPQFMMELLSIGSHYLPVLKMLEDEGYVDWVLRCFADSNSWSNAGTNSTVIVSLAPRLGKDQLEGILHSILTNGQIQSSYSAQNTLRPFLYGLKGKVDETVRTEASKAL